MIKGVTRKIKALAAAGALIMLSARMISVDAEEISAQQATYTARDTILYKDDQFSGQAYGRILRGAEITVEETGESFSKIMYGEYEGYILSSDITEDYRIPRIVRGEEPRLYPISRNIETIDDETVERWSEFIGSGVEDDTMMRLLTTKDLVIPAELINEATYFNINYLVLSYSPEQDEYNSEYQVVLKIPTKELPEDAEVDISFTWEDNRFAFDAPESAKQLLSDDKDAKNPTLIIYGDVPQMYYGSNIIAGECWGMDVYRYEIPNPQKSLSVAYSADENKVESEERGESSTEEVKNEVISIESELPWQRVLLGIVIIAIAIIGGIIGGKLYFKKRRR